LSNEFSGESYSQQEWLAESNHSQSRSARAVWPGDS